MSNVKDTIEAYEIGFAKGFAAGTDNASDLHATELAINRVRKDEEVRAAYNSGYVAAVANQPTAVNDPRLLTKISAIKLVRERVVGISLYDAKKFVEEIWTASNIKF